jgi:hypothetical protein
MYVVLSAIDMCAGHNPTELQLSPSTVSYSTFGLIGKMAIDDRVRTSAQHWLLEWSGRTVAGRPLQTALHSCHKPPVRNQLAI